ncbi:MAG: type II secretion system F family protein [candidate division WOR-3 bacterium]
MPAAPRCQWRSSLLLKITSYAAIFLCLALLGLVAAQIGINYRRRFLVRTEEKVESLYVGIRPQRLWLLTLVAGGCGAALMGLITDFHAFAVGLGALAGFILPRLYLHYLEVQRRKKFESQLTDAVTLIAGAMKSGMSLPQALERVTRELGPPIRQEFAYALQENQVGKPIIQALEDMKNRIKSEDLSITVDAIGIAMETGGILSEVLLKIAETIRSRNRVRSKIGTLTAQGQMQGVVLCLMPWVLAAALFAVDRQFIGPMFSTTQGQLMLGGIVLLELIGLLMIRRLVALDV